MKFSIQLKFLVIFVSVISCKQSFAITIFQDPIITSKTNSVKNNFEYKYVTAKSGLNFRESPQGKVLGKFPLNKGVKVIEHTKIFETINDGWKTLKGEWVGVEKEKDTVYVFNAFLSDSFVISEMKIYNVQPFYNEKKNYFRTAFLNLSESYFNYTETESTILPQDEELKDTIILNKIQRKEFLKKTNISESDNLFIYDIKADSIHSYKIKHLIAIACINIYYNDYSHSSKTEDDFEFGFDLKKNYRGSYDNFAFVGKENPFQTGKLKPIFWERIEREEFPDKFKKEATFYSQKFSFENLTLGDSYKFLNDHYTYYVQNLQREKLVFARYLVVIDSNTNEVVINKVYKDTESTSLIPLNIEDIDYGIQRTGELFKNKPPIIFGFLGHSFGCPSIDFLSEKEPPIMILCDNRH